MEDFSCFLCGYSVYRVKTRAMVLLRGLKGRAMTTVTKEMVEEARQDNRAHSILLGSGQALKERGAEWVLDYEKNGLLSSGVATDDQIQRLRDQIDFSVRRN